MSLFEDILSASNQKMNFSQRKKVVKNIFKLMKTQCGLHAGTQPILALGSRAGS